MYDNRNAVLSAKDMTTVEASKGIATLLKETERASEGSSVFDSFSARLSNLGGRNVVEYVVVNSRKNNEDATVVSAIWRDVPSVIVTKFRGAVKVQFMNGQFFSFLADKKASKYLEALKVSAPDGFSYRQARIVLHGMDCL